MESKLNKAVALYMRAHMQERGNGPDPRKTPRGRKPRKTDARTGFAYFFGDDGVRFEYQTADFSDPGMTMAQWNRLRKMGCKEK